MILENDIDAFLNENRYERIDKFVDIEKIRDLEKRSFKLFCLEDQIKRYRIVTTKIYGKDQDVYFTQIFSDNITVNKRSDKLDEAILTHYNTVKYILIESERLSNMFSIE